MLYFTLVRKHVLNKPLINLFIYLSLLCYQILTRLTHYFNNWIYLRIYVESKSTVPKQMVCG